MENDDNPLACFHKESERAPAGSEGFFFFFVV